MNVSGDDAKRYKAIFLDNYSEKDRLIEADDQTGYLKYLDRGDETINVTLGPHIFRLVHKTPRELA